MFRKIHSNRDPKDTVLTELRKEFKIYFVKASRLIAQLLQKKPGITFGGMIILLLLSAGLSFTVFRNKEPKVSRRNVKVNPVTDGFNRILSAGAAIRQTLVLKHEIDSLAAIKTLSGKDSEVLVNDLDKLQQLNKPFSK